MYIEGLKSFLEPGMRRVRCEMERLLASEVSLLGETNRSLLGSGGKGMRPGLALLLAGALGGVTSISYRTVEVLPNTGEAGVIYLVAHPHGDSDSYDEYIWTGSAYEKIGNTDVDLSGYVRAAELSAISNAQIDTICAT